MLVVIDSCILFTDFMLRDAAFEIIWKYGTEIGVKLAIPESVLEETVANHRTRYSGACSKLTEAKNLIEKISHDKVLLEQDHFFGPGWYRDFLVQGIKSRGTIVPPTKTIFRSVLSRCLGERRPFTESSDRGFKDALIWETVLGLLRKSKEKIAFITLDEDFLDDSKSRLHKHLLDDLTDMGWVNRVILYKSLSEFTESSLLSCLRHDYRLEAAYLKRGNPVFSIPDFLSSYEVRGMLQLNDLDPEDCCLPRDISSLVLRNFENWEIGSEIEVRSLGGKKKLCIFDASADCMAHWRVPEPARHRRIATDEEDRMIAIEYLPDYSALRQQASRRCKMKMEMVIDYKIGRWVSWSHELIECHDPKSI